MGSTSNSTSVRIRSAIALLLLQGVLSCKHSTKTQPGPSQVHVGNLLEVDASPGIIAVQAQIGGLTFSLASPVVAWGSQHVALVPLLPVGTNLTFAPSTPAERTVEIVASPLNSDPPGTTTLALLDELAGLESTVQTSSADAQGALSLLAAAAGGLRDEVLMAQKGPVALGSFGGAPLTLDANALALLDAGLSGSLEPVVPLRVGSSPTPHVSASRSATSNAGLPLEIGLLPLSLIALVAIVSGTEAALIVAGVGGVFLVASACAALLAAPLLDGLSNSTAPNNARLNNEISFLDSMGVNLGPLASSLANSGAILFGGGPDADLANHVFDTTHKVFPPCAVVCAPGLACEGTFGCTCTQISCVGLHHCSPDFSRCLGDVSAPCTAGSDCLSQLCINGACNTGGGSCLDPLGHNTCVPGKTYCTDKGTCCAPNCDFTSCGQDDGCGMGSKCGCSPGATCDATTGSCCVPKGCDDTHCGQNTDNGCHGTCGCTGAAICNPSGSCCVSKCDFHVCGGSPDPCTSKQCWCARGYNCQGGICMPCTPCDFNTCGEPDDCNPGSFCGCRPPATCVAGGVCGVASTGGTDGGGSTGGTDGGGMSGTFDGIYNGPVTATSAGCSNGTLVFTITNGFIRVSQPFQGTGSVQSDGSATFSGSIGTPAGTETLNFNTTPPGFVVNGAAASGSGTGTAVVPGYNSCALTWTANRQ